MPRTLHVISHTHWDREWYLPFQQFRLRLVDLIDNLLDLLDSDPDFKHFHLDGQMIVLDDYLEVRPSQRERLAKHIRAGRIVIGPWYLQNDTFLTSAEATVRNLLYGIRAARQWTDAVMYIGYLPDQFGNISQLPQILRGVGIDCAVLGRGYRPQAHRNEGEFEWVSPDGSRVLAIHLPNWYNNAQRLPVDPEQTSRLLQRIVERCERFAQTSHLLLMNGVDHLEAQEDLSQALSNVRPLLPDGTNIVHTTLPAYVECVKKSAPALSDVTGELREGDDYHLLHGTLSARVYLKQQSFANQDLLERYVEPLAAWVGALGLDVYPREHMEFLWKKVMQNHPHDSICGCSRDAVHETMMTRFREAREVMEAMLERSEKRLIRQIDTRGFDDDDQILLVYNTSSRNRSQVVEALVDLLADDGENASFRLYDADGRPVPYVTVDKKRVGKRGLSPINLPSSIPVIRHRIRFMAENVSGMGYAAYRVQITGGPLAGEAGPNMPAHSANERPETNVTREPLAASGANETPGSSGANEPLAGEAGREQPGHEALLPENDAPVLENEWLRADILRNGTIRLTDKLTGLRYDGIHLFEDASDIGHAYVSHPVKHDTVLTTAESRAEICRIADNDLEQAYRIEISWELPFEADEETQTRSELRMPYRIVSEVRLEKNSRVLAFRTIVDNCVRDHRLRVLFPVPFEDGECRAGGQMDVVRRNHDTEWPRDRNTHPNWRFVDLSGTNGGIAIVNRGLHEYELMKRPGGLALTLLRAVRSISRRNAQAPDEFGPDPGNQCPGIHRFEYGVYVHGAGISHADMYLTAEEFANPLKCLTRPVNDSRWREGRPWVQEPGIQGVFERPDPNADKPKLPLQAQFVRLSAPELLIGTLKFAEDRPSVIVRLWNPEERLVNGTVSCRWTVRGAYLVNLLEERQSPLKPEGGSVEVSLLPKQFRTIELELEP